MPLSEWAGKQALGIHGMWCSYNNFDKMRVLLLRGRYFTIIESAAPTEIVFMDPSPPWRRVSQILSSLFSVGKIRQSKGASVDDVRSGWVPKKQTKGTKSADL